MFAGLGMLLGAFGVAFNALVLAALDLFTGWSKRAGWTLVIALSAGLTTLLFVLPAATGGGEQLIEPLVALHLPLSSLLGLLFVRLVARWPATRPVPLAVSSHRSWAWPPWRGWLSPKRSRRSRRRWRSSLRPSPLSPWRRCSRPRCGHPWSAWCWSRN